jgi:hypothetical protein
MPSLAFRNVIWCINWQLCVQVYFVHHLHLSFCVAKAFACPAWVTNKGLTPSAAPPDVALSPLVLPVPQQRKHGNSTSIPLKPIIVKDPTGASTSRKDSA